MLRTAGWLLVLPLLSLVACNERVAGTPGAIDPVLRPLVQEFRVVNWNACGTGDCGVPDNDSIAALVAERAQEYEANVITLQEGNGELHWMLERLLGRSWTCYAWWTGGELLITCVKGEAQDFEGKDLEGKYGAYTQLRYRGVMITNVHTQCGRNDDDICARSRDVHVPQLHREVKTGIVAGDFNLENPEYPDWHQTNPNPRITLPNWEETVDHVLSVEEPLSSWGEVLDHPEGHPDISNHRMIVAGVTLETPLP